MSDVDDLAQAAIEARRKGEFNAAAELFGQAAQACDDRQRSANLRIREACCLLAVDRTAEAAAIAEQVAHASRAEGFLVELADALGLIVDHLVRSGRLAEGSHLLSEALDVLERLPDDASIHDVVHNLAATHEHSGFYPAAIQLFQRALLLAPDDESRTFTRASMTSSYHFAAAWATDPAERQQFLDEGLAAADASALEDTEILTQCSALAHGAMMLVRAGRYEEALERADRAEAIAMEHGLIDDGMYAAAARSIALWRLHRDVNVLGSVSATLRLAEQLNRADELAILLEVQVEVLWTLGRFDEARRAMEANLEATRSRLAGERSVRREHVRLGVEHRRMEVLSASDPLTGLNNRRHLERVLPALLQAEEPLVLGVIDLDGFKQVNDSLGYAAGDNVIREVADLLEGLCRRSDTVVRLGGDEFVLILRGADARVADRVFERVRSMLDGHRFQGLPDDISLSASIGVLVVPAGQPRELREALADASAAMQRSKHSGRNRVTFVPQTGS